MRPSARRAAHRVPNGSFQYQMLCPTKQNTSDEWHGLQRPVICHYDSRKIIFHLACKSYAKQNEIAQKENQSSIPNRGWPCAAIAIGQCPSAAFALIPPTLLAVCSKYSLPLLVLSMSHTFRFFDGPNEVPQF
jgi:hypothetical protein